MNASKRLAVLLSGRGSNFLAIHEACVRGELPAEVVVVISNKTDARGIERARELGLPAFAIDHKKFSSRADHEAEIVRILDGHAPDIVVLAGYMRLLSAGFVARYRHRITNIHPSLLPSFPGVDAQKQAVEYGVKVSGCTVHLVDESLDGGPILVQRPVPVFDADDADILSERILAQEHAAYVEALRRICGGYRVEGRRVLFERN